MNDGEYFVTRIFVIMFLIIVYTIFNSIVSSNHNLTVDKVITKKYRFEKTEVFFRKYQHKINSLVGLLCPLYYCYYIGIILGEMVYDELMNKKDENRIASWLF